MEIVVSNKASRPLYEQIASQIKDGFIETTAGKGCYVSAQNQDFYLEEQQKKIEEKFSEAIEIARTSGISLDKLAELLTLMYQEDE